MYAIKNNTGFSQPDGNDGNGMSSTLFPCPQEGCSARLSPLANACPKCGYDVLQYLREDLRGITTTSTSFSREAADS
jgi:hypothetical protein